MERQVTPTMTWRTWSVAIITVFVVACGGDVTESSTDLHPCDKPDEGAWAAAAARSCYRSFPLETLSGYWVVGFEISLFYGDLKSAIARDDSGVWLETSPAASAQLRSKAVPGLEYFEITFEGRRPKVDWLVWQYEGMVYVDKFLKISEIMLDAARSSTSTESPN